MFEFTLTTAKGESRDRQLGVGDYTLGRGFSCDIRLAGKDVARQHAVLQVSSDHQVLRSTGIEHAVWVNGDRIDEYGPIHSGDVVQIGGNRIDIVQATHRQLAQRESRPEPQPNTDDTSRAPRTNDLNAEAAGSASTRYAQLTPLRKTIQEEIQAQLDLYRRNQISDMSVDELRNEATEMAWRVVREGRVSIPSDVDQSVLVEQVVAEAIGLGPIEPLLADESITEVMVNGAEQVYVERAGRLEPSALRFINDRSLMSVIERIVTPLGRRIDEGVPMVDARLRDGSRVNAIIPPLSMSGPILTIRKFPKRRFVMQNLVELGSLSPQMAAFLEICVNERRNIVIAGGTGSGKTTFLNALSDWIPNSERIVTIEDAAELRLAQQHVISLEARPSNIEGKGQVTIRDLVRNALRMRPDRIIVGECRGGEALDMLQAMNTGHDGSLTTGHANSPRDLLSRLEVMVLMAGMELPVRAIREQISSAVDIIVHQTRFKDGKRRITDIVEVDGMEGDVVLTQQLFRFEQQGVDADGNVLGEYAGLGTAPRFFSELEAAGLSTDRSLFQGRWQPSCP